MYIARQSLKSYANKCTRIIYFLNHLTEFINNIKSII